MVSLGFSVAVPHSDASDCTVHGCTRASPVASLCKTVALQRRTWTCAGAGAGDGAVLT